jgi:hypothetical protein
MAVFTARRMEGYLGRMEYLWQAWEGFGAEHVDVRANEANGTFIRDFRVDYTVRWDDAWRTTFADVRCRGRSFTLDTLPDGCVDVDVMAVTFTNTLPIRRLRLAVGASHEIDAAYIVVPDLAVRVDRQRYTRLGANEYRYEGLATGFTAVLTVDDDGIVIDYPGLSRRVMLPAPRK